MKVTLEIHQSRVLTKEIEMTPEEFEATRLKFRTLLGDELDAEEARWALHFRGTDVPFVNVVSIDNHGQDRNS